MLKGFKDFLFRGNVVDLAIAVVVGTAFTAVVTTITDSFITPIVNSVAGPDAVDGLGFRILSDNPATYVDLAAIINGLITFTIIAAVVYFLVVVPMNKVNELSKADEEDEENIVLLREIRDALTKH